MFLCCIMELIYHCVSGKCLKVNNLLFLQSFGHSLFINEVIKLVLLYRLILKKWRLPVMTLSSSNFIQGTVFAHIIMVSSKVYTEYTVFGIMSILFLLEGWNKEENWYYSQHGLFGVYFDDTIIMSFWKHAFNKILI